MKMSLSADELEELEGLSDAELAKAVRDSLSKFRSKGARDDGELPPPQTGTPSKGGPSTSTLETANDSAQRLRELGLSERRIREIQQPFSASEADRAAAAALIPGMDRLK